MPPTRRSRVPPTLPPRCRNTPENRNSRNRRFIRTVFQTRSVAFPPFRIVFRIVFRPLCPPKPFFQTPFKAFPTIQTFLLLTIRHLLLLLTIQTFLLLTIQNPFNHHPNPLPPPSIQTQILPLSIPTPSKTRSIHPWSFPVAAGSPRFYGRFGRAKTWVVGSTVAPNRGTSSATSSCGPTTRKHQIRSPIPRFLLRLPPIR